VISPCLNTPVNMHCIITRISHPWDKSCRLVLVLLHIGNNLTAHHVYKFCLQKQVFLSKLRERTEGGREGRRGQEVFSLVMLWTVKYYIMPVVDEWNMTMQDIGGLTVRGENQSTWCPRSNMFNTNPTWTATGQNTGLNDRLTRNCLCHGVVSFSKQLP